MLRLFDWLDLAAIDYVKSYEVEEVEGDPILLLRIKFHNPPQPLNLFPSTVTCTLSG